jgi:SHS2 domain-containing protein
MAFKYTFLDHTADIAVDVESTTLNELFTGAAIAWRESICDDLSEKHDQKKKIELSEQSLEILLVSFLNELNFIFQSESWMMGSVNSINIFKKDSVWHLRATIFGGVFNRRELKLKAEIKAVTYHQMEIKEINGKYSTRIVFDI